MGELHEGTRIRDLGLTIEGTRLQRILDELLRELAACGIDRVKPHVYLSTEWGVPFGTISIAIPFYLARGDLTALHERRFGHVEGAHPADILRYLRHEMGHVANYAWKLYERPEWISTFGAITQPYPEEYRPDPFSKRFVTHLPGWYAQRHPDEDWAETFAVWLTPGLDWRAAYAGWPEAARKIELCDRLMREVRGTEPPVTATEADEDVRTLADTLDDYYRRVAPDPAEAPPGLDGALRAIFDEIEIEPGAATRSAAALVRAMRNELVSNVYRWTGHYPERTRPLLDHLARRAEALALVYPGSREREVVVGITTLVTALAQSWTLHGSYLH